MAVDDVRVQRSCRALSDALLAELAEGSVLDVTISALCTRAGVSRPTFYQHFTSVEDLLGCALRLRLDHLDATAGSFAEVLRSLAADRALYGARVQQARVLPTVFVTLTTWTMDRMRAQHPHLDPAAVEFAAAGATRLVVSWLRDPQRSAEETATLVRTLAGRTLGLDEADLTLPVACPASTA